MSRPRRSPSPVAGRFVALLCLWLAACPSLFAAFGLTTATDYYQVDTGAGLVFKVRRTDNGSSTQSAGDIMSLVWNGVEYQNQSRGSQVTSGFDYLYTGVSAVTVSAAVVNTDYIKITVQAGDLTHYYMARNGYPHIYMGTTFATEPDIHGLVRYIFRIPQTLLPNGPTPSDIHETVSTVESGDIFALANGETRSKHYSNMRVKDWSYIGATGTNVGMWVVRDNNEGASGGPFYRCLLNQCGSDQEITYIVNYGEAQTEAFRTGLFNAYTFVATTGSTPPASIDTSWFANMDLAGYLAPAGRGSVAGAGITGRDTNFAYTVGMANSAAQYWGDADALTGAFTIPDVRPGDYTLTVYKNELAVHTASVSVAAGASTAVSSIALTADPARTIPLWRVGSWDGTPAEFINGAQITTMHPSDPRLASWTPGDYVVGTSAPATGFPCYQWKDVNGTQNIVFTLTSAQLLASTVRVGITCAYANARPRITVNSWTSSIPAISTQPSTRTLTVGTYRGNNTTYTFSVPASALVVGTNTLSLSPVSGSGAAAYLSAGYSIDCVDLSQVSTSLDVPAAPASLSAVAATGVRRVDLSWSSAARATSYNVFRARSAAGPFTRVAAGLSATSYADSDVADSGDYYYRVTAENSSGAGLPVSASTQLASISLTWTGASSAVWDTAAANWISSATSSAAPYTEGDGVRFDDTSSVLAVTLSGALSPSSVTVNSSKNYSFVTGTLAGTGNLSKAGTGTLTLSTAHTYTGGTVVSGGTLALAAGGSLSGSVALSGGATFRMAAAGTNFPGNALAVAAGSTATLASASLSNGYSGAVSGPADATFTLSGPVSFGATGTAQLGSFLGTVSIPSGSQLRFSSTSGANGNGGASATFVVNGTLNTRNAGGAGGVVLGALSGSGSVQGQTNTNTGTVTYFVGAKGIDTTFSGVIANGANGTAILHKQGSGALVLSGANTYTGATTVSAGSLHVTGSLGSTAVSVASGATLGGTGTLGGNLTLASGARLALGVGASATRGPTVSGASTLNGAITVVPALLGGSLASGTYPLLTYSGSLAGSPTFTWLDTTGSGAVASFDTATAGVVKITVVVPPAAPTGLVAVAGDARVSLSWSAVSGASSYTVLRSTVGGSGYATVAAGLATTAYEDTGLINGATYYYVVTATNAAGTGVASDEIAASPVLPLSALESWRETYFGTASATGSAANDADPDGDGVPNLLEYALGGLPDDPSSAPDPVVALSPDASPVLTLTFATIADPTLSYAVEASSDLATWTTIWSLPSSTVAGSRTVADTEAVSSASRRFLRLRVSTTSP